MNTEELKHLGLAVLVLFLIASFKFVLDKTFYILPKILIFSVIIIALHVLSKIGIAHLFEASVIHRIWGISDLDKKRKIPLKKEIPAGLIFPLLFSLISLGFLKIATIITYEARALKHTTKKKLGLFTFSQMSDWQNGFIGVVGIASVLLLSVISYFINFELLFQISAYYALVNLIPISELDGNQIFSGSKVLWSILTFIALILTFYAFVL